MRPLLPLILALSFIAAAQTMTGLPGVQITGDSLKPQITNQTGKGIVCLVFRMQLPSGRLATSINWQYNTIPSDGKQHQILSIANSGPNDLPLDVTVDGVVFTDGSFVGPDASSSFASLSRGVAAYVATGKMLTNATDAAAAWNQIQNLSNTSGSSGGQGREADAEAFAASLSAKMLMSTRAQYGDGGAAKMAAWYVALGTLHKAN